MPYKMTFCPNQAFQNIILTHRNVFCSHAHFLFYSTFFVPFLNDYTPTTTRTTKASFRSLRCQKSPSKVVRFLKTMKKMPVLSTVFFGTLIGIMVLSLHQHDALSWWPDGKVFLSEYHKLRLKASVQECQCIVGIHLMNQYSIRHYHFVQIASIL